MLGVLVVVLKIVLAIVFLVSAYAKLGDAARARAMFADFGVPVAWVPRAVPAVAGLELAVGLTLPFPQVAPWSGVAALVLMLVFTAAIGLNLAMGRTPDCNCFGQISAGPIGSGTLVRNLALVLAAAVVTWLGPVDADVWSSGFTGPIAPRDAIEAVGGLAIIGLLALTLHRQTLSARHFNETMARLERRLATTSRVAAPSVPKPASSGLRIGTPAPLFRLPNAVGEMTALSDLLAAGKAVLIVFVSANCPSCAGLTAETQDWNRTHGAFLRVLVITDMPADATAERVDFLIQSGRDVSDAYRTWGAPEAVLVRADGAIGTAIVRGPDQIRQLVARIEAFGPNAPQIAGPSAGTGVERVPIGDRPPDVQFRDRSGDARSFADYIGRDLLLVFWSPNCAYCDILLEQLASWERAPPARAPVILVVTNASQEMTAKIDLLANVILDSQSVLFRLFAVHGTPTGILIDADGHVASRNAAGPDEVMLLANGTMLSPQEAQA